MRAALLAAGVLFTALALLAEPLGLSRGAGFPEGQILCGSIGLFLLLAALAWRKTGALWRAMGRAVMAALAVLLLLKTLMSLLGSMETTAQQNICIRSELVPGTDSPLVFTPHVMWTTPGFPEVPSPGGSVWLYGASDAVVPEEYGTFTDRRQPEYNSTQALILLMLDLRYAPPPETVVIVAGPADARSTLETGDPRFHAGYYRWMEATGSRSSLSMDLSGRDLTEASAWVQHVNRTVLQALGREYSFQPVFYWGTESSESMSPAECDFILQVDSLLKEH